MKRLFLLIVLASALCAACAADGTPWNGEGLPVAPLVLHTPDTGVHPDRSVLDDPANPFAQGELTDATVWQLQSNGGAVAAFYAWATANARGASGERQYYTALDLKTIYDRGMSYDTDLPMIKDVAIRGFQAVLTHFPDAVTYDATGTIAYELVTPSVVAILELGGTADGWVLVMTPDGRTVAVPR
jgi:hypothetical protein